MSLPLLRPLTTTPSSLASTSLLFQLPRRSLSLSAPSLVYTSTAVAPPQPEASTFNYTDHLAALQERTRRLPQKKIAKLAAEAAASGIVPEKKPEVKKLTKDKISFSNLPHGLTHTALKAILEAKGLAVGSVRIMVFPRSDGRFVSRGYGWATLLDPANPKKGMKAAIELDGLVIDERPINIEIGHAKTHNLFFSPERKAARLAYRQTQRKPLAIPVPGQWAYARNQQLIAAGLPVPLIGAPGSAYNLRTELESGKPRKETGAAGSRHMRRFLPGEARPEEGVDGYGLKTGLEEIPVMVGVGGERKWTKKRREEARRDGWGGEEPEERRE